MTDIIRSSFPQSGLLFEITYLLRAGIKIDTITKNPGKIITEIAALLENSSESRNRRLEAQVVEISLKVRENISSYKTSQKHSDEGLTKPRTTKSTMSRHIEMSSKRTSGKPRI